MEAVSEAGPAITLICSFDGYFQSYISTTDLIIAGFPMTTWCCTILIDNPRLCDMAVLAAKSIWDVY